MVKNYKGFILIDTLVSIIILSIIFQLSYKSQLTNLETQERLKKIAIERNRVINTIETKLVNNGKEPTLCSQSIMERHLIYVCNKD